MFYCRKRGEVNSGKCYVYEHFEPVGGDVVYVGMGQGGRAWMTDNRSAAHSEWIEQNLDAGYVPDEFVRVVERQLPAGEARAIEKVKIEDYGINSLFNGIQGKPHGCPQLSAEDRNLIKSLRDEGLTYQAISEQVGTSVGTVQYWVNKLSE